LIGAGPGDPQLLTVKAVNVLNKADIIFHDDLVDVEYLDSFPCEKVYVGKRKGKHHKTQDEINRLLLEATQNHSCVVRLKGGDPFIFGRGGEELRFLKEKGVSISIVPGVTASMAAAASVQIPLTLRGVSRVLTFLPAHNIDHEEVYIPKEGTSVYYMGSSKINVLSNKLREKGTASDTPVALIQHASLENEKIEITNVKEMSSTRLASPLVIIIGNVVKEYAKHE